VQIGTLVARLPREFPIARLARRRIFSRLIVTIMIMPILARRNGPAGGHGGKLTISFGGHSDPREDIFGNTHVTRHVGVSSCGQCHRNTFTVLITFLRYR